MMRRTERKIKSSNLFIKMVMTTENQCAGGCRLLCPLATLILGSCLQISCTHQEGGHTCEEGSLAFHPKYKQQIVMIEGVLRLLKSSSFQKLSIKVSYNVVSDLFTCYHLYSFTCHPFLCHTFTLSQFPSFILFHKEGHNEWFLPY